MCIYITCIFNLYFIAVMGKWLQQPQIYSGIGLNKSLNLSNKHSACSREKKSTLLNHLLSLSLFWIVIQMNFIMLMALLCKYMHMV